MCFVVERSAGCRIWLCYSKTNLNGYCCLLVVASQLQFAGELCGLGAAVALGDRRRDRPTPVPAAAVRRGSGRHRRRPRARSPPAPRSPPGSGPRGTGAGVSARSAEVVALAALAAPAPAWLRRAPRPRTPPRRSAEEAAAGRRRLGGTGSGLRFFASFSSRGLRAAALLALAPALLALAPPPGPRGGERVLRAPVVTHRRLVLRSPLRPAR